MPDNPASVIITVVFKDSPESQTFAMRESDVQIARSKAEKWARGQFGDRVADLTVNNAPENVALADIFIEKGLIIPS